VIGSDVRRQYVVIGRPMNLAARLMQEAGAGLLAAGPLSADRLAGLDCAPEATITPKGFGRTVETFLAPPGFVCTITTEVTANDSLSCVGDFIVDVQVIGGRVRTSPAPEPGMDASLFVLVGDARYGPFPTTGP